jgi:hypothetical protein
MFAPSNPGSGSGSVSNSKTPVSAMTPIGQGETGTGIGAGLGMGGSEARTIVPVTIIPLNTTQVRHGMDKLKLRDSVGLCGVDREGSGESSAIPTDPYDPIFHSVSSADDTCGERNRSEKSESEVGGDREILDLPIAQSAGHTEKNISTLAPYISTHMGPETGPKSPSISPDYCGLDSLKVKPDSGKGPGSAPVTSGFLGVTLPPPVRENEGIDDEGRLYETPLVDVTTGLSALSISSGLSGREGHPAASTVADSKGQSERTTAVHTACDVTDQPHTNPTNHTPHSAISTTDTDIVQGNVGMGTRVIGGAKHGDGVALSTGVSASAVTGSKGVKSSMPSTGTSLQSSDTASSTVSSSFSHVAVTPYLSTVSTIVGTGIKTKDTGIDRFIQESEGLSGATNSSHETESAQNKPNIIGISGNSAEVPGPPATSPASSGSFFSTHHTVGGHTVAPTGHTVGSSSSSSTSSLSKSLIENEKRIEKERQTKQNRLSKVTRYHAILYSTLLYYDFLKCASFYFFLFIFIPLGLCQTSAGRGQHRGVRRIQGTHARMKGMESAFFF